MAKVAEARTTILFGTRENKLNRLERLVSWGSQRLSVPRTLEQHDRFEQGPNSQLTVVGRADATIVALALSFPKTISGRIDDAVRRERGLQ